MASFIPRASFPNQLSLPRSYFLGHHAAGLSKMKTMLSSIDLIVECRDYRVPLTSRNPLFESVLAGRERLVVYTKRDLGSKFRGADRTREEIIERWHAPSPVLFSYDKSTRDIKAIFNVIKDYASRSTSLIGSRILVVGMPNVGKSSLLNALRYSGTKRHKAASTGAQPGVTRKIASGVKIVDKDTEKGTEGVYLVDTPGVFVPFVPDAEAMLKLALVGCVKDTIIAPVTLADYLLYHINKSSYRWELYASYSSPTNDIAEMLEGMCRKTGRLGKGGVPDIDAAALWFIQKWRNGEMGTFVLDEVTEDGLHNKKYEDIGTSLTQAKARQKSDRVAKTKLRTPT